MTKWIVANIDILDEPADVLICSANVFLNLSGGVGGELLRRYGNALQEELHSYLKRNHMSHLKQGDIVETPPHGAPYKKILHAVAVDGFYYTSSEAIRTLVEKCLGKAAVSGCKTVAMTALGTGYGRFPMKEFARAITPLLQQNCDPIRTITICVPNKEKFADLDTILHTAM